VNLSACQYQPLDTLQVRNPGCIGCEVPDRSLDGAQRNPGFLPSASRIPLRCIRATSHQSPHEPKILTRLRLRPTSHGPPGNGAPASLSESWKLQLPETGAVSAGAAERGPGNGWGLRTRGRNSVLVKLTCVIRTHHFPPQSRRATHHPATYRALSTPPLPVTPPVREQVTLHHGSISCPSDYTCAEVARFRDRLAGEVLVTSM